MMATLTMRCVGDDETAFNNSDKNTNKPKPILLTDEAKDDDEGVADDGIVFSNAAADDKKRSKTDHDLVPNDVD